MLKEEMGVFMDGEKKAIFLRERGKCNVTPDLKSYHMYAYFTAKIVAKFIEYTYPLD
jgi:hypothetical protein